MKQKETLLMLLTTYKARSLN